MALSSTNELSRRRFLRRTFAAAGVASAGWLLAACGGAAAPASVAPSSLAPASPAASPKPASAPASGGASAKPAASPANASAPASAKPGGLTLTIASTTTAGSQSPLWMADALHLYADRGLTVKSVLVPSDAAVKVLLAKEVDVLMQAAAPVITANVNGGTDLVYVGSLFNHSQFAMGAPLDIKTGADLKGKLVGTDRPGTTTEYQTKVLLDILGLKLTDVQLRPLGNADTIYAALLSGQLQGGTISQPHTFKIEGQGYHIIADTYKVPYQSLGPVVQKARLNELTPALLQFLDAMRAAIRAYNTQADTAKKVVSTNLKETDQDILDKTYDFYTKQAPFQEDLKPTVEGMIQIRDFLAESSVPKAKDYNVQQLIDNSLLDKLPKS
jgi:ABC-type nitrate/sulfonate/bicarbonate transport system substrate-binding protein